MSKDITEYLDELHNHNIGIYLKERKESNDEGY